MTDNFPLQPLSPGAIEVIQESHITELYLAYLFFLQVGTSLILPEQVL